MDGIDCLVDCFTECLSDPTSESALESCLRANCAPCLDELDIYIGDFLDVWRFAGGFMLGEWGIMYGFWID